MNRGLAVLWIAACHRAPSTTLPPAGDERDDGAGVLARASVQIVIGEGSDDKPSASPRHHRVTSADDADDDDGDEYGGAGYANWHPTATTATTARPPHYTVVDSDLDGGITGTVTWSGPAPHLPCGTGLRLGADHAVRGAAVYIEHVRQGRAFPAYAQPLQIGGTLTKRGCTLSPVVQIVAPAPGPLAIRGDADAIELRVSGATTSELELQARGTATLDVVPGVTEISGSGALAWAIGVETPYVAITDDDGQFRIDALPPAVYDVTIFAPPATLAGTPIITHRSVRVGSGSTKINVALH